MRAQSLAMILTLDIHLPVSYRGREGVGTRKRSSRLRSRPQRMRSTKASARALSASCPHPPTRGPSSPLNGYKLDFHALRLPLFLPARCDPEVPLPLPITLRD